MMFSATIVGFILIVNFISSNYGELHSRKVHSPIASSGQIPFFVAPPPPLRTSEPLSLRLENLKVPHSGHQIRPLPHGSFHEPHLVVNPSGNLQVPKIIVSPPQFRAVAPLPLANVPNLHPPHPLEKSFARSADPRHVHHVHHHVHHADFHHGHHSGIHSHGHHHLVDFTPVHHHHVHHVPKKPHGLFIKKETKIIKKFREAQHDLKRPHRRMKRTLPDVLVARLATDPRSKVDLMSTIDNVKDATKNVCESIQSPVYHIRDAIGSARDVVFSLMKMTPTGLLIPSTYGIMELRPSPETVGAINPNIAKYDEKGKPLNADTQVVTNDIYDKNTGETRTTVQFMLKNGFRKARDSVQHAGDVVHSVRRAVLTIPRSALQLLFPFYKSIELDTDKDKLKQAALLGVKPVIPDATPRLVGAGRLLELMRAAVSGEDHQSENVLSPLTEHVKSAFNNNIKIGKEKYQNYIKKLQDDVKARFQGL